MRFLFKKGFFYVLEDLVSHTVDKGLIEIGYFPNKPFTLNYEFTNLSFSIILSGKGFYNVDGKRHKVEAPCVLIQLPGHHYHYGPETGDHWEEFYFIYEAKQVGRLCTQTWLDPKTPVRTINNKFSVQDSIRELQKATLSNRPKDILVHLSERVMLETLMPLPANENDLLIAKIRDIAVRLKTNLNHPMRFENIADELDISYSTFRRLWYDLYGTSPKSYQQRQRITEASRLLLSTNQSVLEIAQGLGFNDSGYFSRVFRNALGCSPTEYRQRSKWTLAPEYLTTYKPVPDESETRIHQENLTNRLTEYKQ